MSESKGLKSALTLVAMAMASLTLPVAARTTPKPLKVFILAGQSNMEGHAQVRTFDYLARDAKTVPILKEMRNADGTPRVCENVWISYLTGDGDEYNGKLTAGYGAKGREPKIGPELTFGIYTQKLLDEPILLIKTAWGGKSLHTDFRPPSAGPYEFNEAQLAWLKQHERDIEEAKAEKVLATGHYYRLMAEHVKKVLTDIKRVVPDYDPEQGYELAGYVWFQGWNDMVDASTYPDRDKPGGYDQYSKLLAHFIRDVRKEFSAPRMSFIIGVMGVGGLQEDPNDFRRAMAVPADMPEFKGNVVAVPTAPFWDEALVTASTKKDNYNRILDTAHSLTEEGRLDRDAQEFPGWHSIGTPEPGERIWRYVSFDVQQDVEKLDKGADKRFREVSLPSGMEQWFTPSFDDSQWKQGKAPIGTGTWKHHRSTVKNSTDWGDGEFLLMRTSFELDAVDCESYRLS
ncbi:MAG: sialate O-acetylesterase, partial [Opitutales bacterium]